MTLFNCSRSILVHFFGLVLILSCTQNKTKVVEKELLVKDNTTTIGTNQGVSRDSTLTKYRNPRSHDDSIKKWNAQLIDEKEKFKLTAGPETQNFSIDTKTGEVIGYPFFKIQGEEGRNNKRKKSKSLRTNFLKIKPKIRSNLMQDRKGELWYGDPKNAEIEGTSEAVHSGRGPTGFLYTEDGNYLIVPVGYPHGGVTDELFFFDSNGIFISKTTLDRSLNMPFVEFNAEQTFVSVSDGVSGDFYFFKIDGSLVRKGNFNEITKDKGTSYGKPIISETGDFWILQNNLGYLFENDSLVTKISGHNFFIDEHRKLLYYDTGGKFVITDIENKEIKYQLIQKDILLLSIQGRQIRLQNLINKKKYSYEIF